MGTPFCDGRKWQDNGPFGDIVVRQLEIAQESVRYGCFESRRPGFWGVWGGRLLHFCAPFRSQGRLKVAPYTMYALQADQGSSSEVMGPPRRQAFEAAANTGILAAVNRDTGSPESLPKLSQKCTDPGLARLSWVN